ncbi:MAG TPA: IS1595 family transposase [Pyrinomonadaceae bacterium]|nr:IS1595 family transposase [Pyrinomonadaceae bacterium]
MQKGTKQPRKVEKGSLLEPHFQNEDAGREYLEAQRWPEGPICPHCGLIGEAYKIVRKEKTQEEIDAMRLAKKRVRKTQKGVWKCAGCRKQFTATVGTIFEDSHIPLHKWLLAIHLLCSSKKGMSAHQLMRNLDIKQYKSAWFMAHRIRYAMTGELPQEGEKMTGIIEADETYIGGRRRRKVSHAVKPGVRAQDYPSQYANKQAVFSIVQRGGKVHSRHIERVTADNLRSVLDDVASKDAHLMTDTGVLWKKATGRKHSLVNHTADEYVRHEEGVCITTNTVEGYFSLVKRGINGVYHHVGRKHLHRYLSEFDFRYNEREVTDGERAQTALRGIEGKRLTYNAAGS